MFQEMDPLLIPFVVSGIMMFPVVFLVITFGISVIILGLLPIHCFHTYYCILRYVHTNFVVHTLRPN